MSRQNANGRVIYSFESLITLKQPPRNIRGRQNDSLEIGPESRYAFDSKSMFKKGQVQQ